MKMAKFLGIKRGLDISPLLGTPKLTSDQAQALKIEQLRAVSQLNNVIVLGCLINAAVLVLTFWGSSLSGLMVWWGVIIAATMSAVLFLHVRKKDKNDFEADTDGHIARFIRGTTSVGVLWALVPMIAIPVAGVDSFTGVGLILTATMFGGVLFIGRIPEAAMGLVLPITAGILIGLQFLQDPGTNILSIVVLTYAGILYFASRLAYSQFATQHMDKIALQDQTEVIGLLLRDFEENTADWLWETDAEGIIRPLATEYGLTITENEALKSGNALLEAFVETDIRHDLSTSLRKQVPFRDYELKLQFRDAAAWISLSGKPLFEKDKFVGFRGVATDITKAKQTKDQVDFLAHYDALTRLPNRTSLDDWLQSHFRKTEPWTNEYALVWVDLDNFKSVNDSLGHQTGDEVLRKVAARLTEFTGDPNLAARISADEFAFICVNTGYSDLCKKLDELSACLNAAYNIWGSTVLCRASLGVKVMSKSQSDTTQLFKHAELALYAAKEAGKGTWALFDQKLENFARAQHELQADLENAIERGELRLFFQPTVDATTHEVVGCETLIRWQHPRKGLLSPDDFIQFAEDTGMITRIGDWVIRQALCEARRLPDHVRIAINVSPLQIHSANLVQTIVNGLATNGIAADRLELEMTESVLISDTEFTMKRLRQLKDLGLRIVLDDFGTGFSSLSYLRQFPFDKLKIDRSFTANLEIDEDSQSITRATLQLAKALGMRVTGEGVETIRQGDFLRDNGCDELQGYLHSRPQPLEKLGHMIELKSAPPPVPANETVAFQTAVTDSVTSLKREA